MLQITIKSRTHIPNYYEWHIGELVRSKIHSEAILGKIISVFADGDELDFILRNWVNIPYMKGARSMIWLGSIAGSIAFNLPVDWNK